MGGFRCTVGKWWADVVKKWYLDRACLRLVMPMLLADVNPRPVREGGGEGERSRPFTYLDSSKTKADIVTKRMYTPPPQFCPS